VRFLLLLLAGLCLAAPAGAQTGEEARKLEHAVARGQLLFELDRAAWVTTDDMFERVPGARDWPIRGWIVEPDGGQKGAYAVTYYGFEPEGPVAYFVGRVRDQRAVSGEAMPPAGRPVLSERQQRLVKAREAAMTLDYAPCTEAPFNIAIIPPPSDEAPLEVYLLSAQTEHDVYPMGGHFLIGIAPDGALLSRRKFMNSCMDLDARPDAAGPEEPAAMFLTHLLDPVPTEIHVFTAIALGKPVYVSTEGGKRIWEVFGPRIRLVDKE
jgi:hypothetical protein